MKAPWNLMALTVILAGDLLLTEKAFACSVCFGDPQSDLTKALRMGILTLLAILLAVLGAFARFFFGCRNRTKLHA